MAPLNKEEIAARKKASHEALLKRIESNLIELYKDSSNLQQSSFSLWLKAYSLSTTSKFTLFHDDLYDNIKTNIINDTKKSLPQSIQTFIERNFIKVAPVSILDPRSTNLRTTAHQSSSSTSKEVIRQKYPSAPKESPTSVPFKIIIPFSKITKIIEKIHKSTATTNSIQEIHIGSKKTYRLLSEYFEGIPRMVVDEYVNRCALCQSDKIVTEKNLRRQRFLQVPKEREIFERLVIDLFGMKDYDDDLQKSIKRYVLQIVDHKSKFRFAYVIPKKEAEYVIPHLHELFGIIGPPRAIQSDCGKEFVNKRMAELANLWGCDFVNSAPRHPQTNGTVERANRELKRKIKSWRKKNMDQDWARFLPVIVHQLNITEHETIGISPYQYVYQIRSWKERRLISEIVVEGSQNSINKDEKECEESNENNINLSDRESLIVEEIDLTQNGDGLVNFVTEDTYNSIATATTIAPAYNNIEENAEDNVEQAEAMLLEFTTPTSSNSMAIPSSLQQIPTVSQSEALDSQSTYSSTGISLSEIRKRADESYRRKTANMEKVYNKHVTPNSYGVNQIVGIVIPSRLLKFYNTASRKGNITAKVYELKHMKESNLVKYKVRTRTHRIKESLDAHQLLHLAGGEESYPAESQWSTEEEEYMKLPELSLKQYVETCDSKLSTANISKTLVSTISSVSRTTAVCNTCKNVIPINSTTTCTSCHQLIHSEPSECAEGRYIIIDKMTQGKPKIYCNIYCASDNFYYPRMEIEPSPNQNVQADPDVQPSSVTSSNETNSEIMPIPKKRRVNKDLPTTSSSTNAAYNLHQHYYYEVPIDYYQMKYDFMREYIEKEGITSKTRWTDVNLAKLEQAAISHIPPIMETVMNLRKQVIDVLKTLTDNNAEKTVVENPIVTNTDDSCYVCDQPLDVATNWHRCANSACKRRIHGKIICPKGALIIADDDKLYCSKECETTADK